MNEDTVAVLEAFDLSQLEALRDVYEARHDSANVANVRAAIDRKGLVQTDELSRSGKLFSHKTVMNDDSGRTMTRWTGDPVAWMKFFQTGAIVGRLDPQLLDETRSGKSQTVRLRHGERVVVTKD